MGGGGEYAEPGARPKSGGDGDEKLIALGDILLTPTNSPSPSQQKKLCSIFIIRFLARNPNLSIWLPENLGHLRVKVTEKTLREWFKNLNEFLKSEHNIVASEFLSTENGSRIFNLDDSGFPLAGTSGKLAIVTN